MSFVRSKLADAWDWFGAYCIPTWMFRVQRRIRYPRGAYYDWKLWRTRPKVGEYATWHGEGPYRVVKVDGDELTFDTGLRASWSNCCEPVPREKA